MVALSSFFGGVGDLEPAYYNKRGAFHTGATISTLKDVVYYDPNYGGDGNWYQYNGSTALPMKVTAGNTPGSNWVNVGAASVYDLVRVKLANLDAALQQVATLTTAVGKKQDADDTLTALANLANAADQLAYFTGVDKLSVTAFTSLARTLLGKSNVTDMQSTLGLGSAALKTVGIAAGNIPDMSSFGVAGTTGVFSSIIVAGQKRIMEGRASVTVNSGYVDFTLPVGYPDANYTFIATDVGSAVLGYAAIAQSGNVVRIYVKTADGVVPTNGTSYGLRYIAMGAAS